MTANGASPRIAALGCGYWGKNVARNFAALDALAAVCDADAATAAAIAAAHRVPAREWRDILDDASIVGVAIATPAARHAAAAHQALLAGKHVFVEKPLALSLEEAQSLCALADERSRVLMVGHLLQYHTAFLALKAIVVRGDLGRLQYIYSNRLNLGKVRREENILWSFAPHDISMILALTGEEPDRVTAVSGTFLHKTVADVTTTHLAFPSGTQAHIFVSWLHPFKEQKLVVIGERAMAVFDDGEPWERKLVVFRQPVEWRDGALQLNKATPEPVAIDQVEPLRSECRHFLDCIANGERPRTDGHEGVRVLRVLQEAQRSMDRAQPPGGQTEPFREKRISELPARQGQETGRFPDVAIHESAYVDEPAEIGAGTKIWHFSHVMPRVRIGRNCVIGQNVAIGPDAIIGNQCKIQNNVSVYKGVTLEDGVFCGPSCVFTNVMNPRAEIERKSEFRPTLVRRGATIGANATIVCGTTIGAYAFVGAGAVVTRDIADFAVVVGSPARRIGWMSKAGARLAVDLVCPIDGTRYREVTPDELVELEDG